jgi:hypothetical protein
VCTPNKCLTLIDVHIIMLSMMNTPPSPARPMRHLVLIDGENLARSASPSRADVLASVRAFDEVACCSPGTQIIVACAHRNAPTVSFGWGSARHLWQSGPDGADRALLDVIANENVAGRYQMVTIGSGDGIFATAAAFLAGQGVHVRVVGPSGGIAVALQLACHEVIELPVPVPPVPAREAVA